MDWETLGRTGLRVHPVAPPQHGRVRVLLCGDETEVWTAVLVLHRKPNGARLILLVKNATTDH
jgi:hypothetical protein